MVTGTEFKRMITESGPASQNPEAVKKIIFCTGKVFYDLIKARRDLGEQVVPVTKFTTIPSELEHCFSLTINIHWGPTIRTSDQCRSEAGAEGSVAPS